MAPSQERIKVKKSVFNSYIENLKNARSAIWKTELAYPSANDMAEDLTNAPGSREYDRAVSMVYAIYFIEIATLQYHHGSIFVKALVKALKVTGHVCGEHAKRYNIILPNNMLADSPYYCPGPSLYMIPQNSHFQQFSILCYAI